MKRMHLFGLVAAFAIAAVGRTAYAASYYWDPNGDTAGTGGAGAWDTATALWRQGTDTGTLVTWPTTGTDNDAYLPNIAAASTITVSGSVTVNDIHVETTNAKNYTLSGGTLALSGASSTIYISDVTSSAVTNIASVITGDASFTKDGAGVLRLQTAINTYTGTTYVNDGTLWVKNVGVVNGTSGIIVADGATLLVQAQTLLTPKPLTINGIGDPGSAGNLGALRLGGTGNNINWAGNVTLGSNASVSGYAATGCQITGSISGDHELEIRGGNNANSEVTLAPSAGNNTYGSTRVTSTTESRITTVIAGNANAFSTGALTMSGATANSSAVLKMNGNNFIFAGLHGDVGTIGNYHASNQATLTIGDATNVSSSYGGIIVDGGSSALALVKTGGGALILSGSNTYTGGTTVNEGALVIDGSLASTGDTSVASGATLGGVGNIGNAVTVLSGGILAPGMKNTAGTLTLENTLSLSGGALLDFDLAGVNASDRVSMASTAMTISGLQFGDFAFNAMAGFGERDYTLFDAGAINGSLGSNVSGSVGEYAAELVVSGDDLVLRVTAIPEPCVLVLIITGLLGMLVYACRRRK